MFIPLGHLTAMCLSRGHRFPMLCVAFKTFPKAPESNNPVCNWLTIHSPHHYFLVLPRKKTCSPLPSSSANVMECLGSHNLSSPSNMSLSRIELSKHSNFASAEVSFEKNQTNNNRKINKQIIFNSFTSLNCSIF